MYRIHSISVRNTVHSNHYLVTLNENKRVIGSRKPLARSEKAISDLRWPVQGLEGALRKYSDLETIAFDVFAGGLLRQGPSHALCHLRRPSPGCATECLCRWVGPNLRLLSRAWNPHFLPTIQCAIPRLDRQKKHEQLIMTADASCQRRAGSGTTKKSCLAEVVRHKVG